jgi:hypothetical protein
MTELNELKKRLSALEEKSAVPKEMVETCVKEYLSEQAEIDKRKSSVIIHGVPEAALEVEGEEGEMRQTTGQERRDNDKAKLLSIGDEKPDMKVEDQDVESIFRLGAIRQDGKPRPVCVKLRNAETRRRLLSNSKCLKQSNTQWHRRVFVNPDLTKAQRELDRKARDELNRRKNNGETNLTIRNFKVVTNNFNRRGQYNAQRDGRRDA